MPSTDKSARGNASWKHTQACATRMRNDPGRTRTCNPRLRKPMPYPVGHGANCVPKCTLPSSDSHTCSPQGRLLNRVPRVPSSSPSSPVLESLESLESRPRVPRVPSSNFSSPSSLVLEFLESRPRIPRIPRVPSSNPSNPVLEFLASLESRRRVPSNPVLEPLESLESRPRVPRIPSSNFSSHLSPAIKPQQLSSC
jgi:hypothetical protein